MLMFHSKTREKLNKLERKKGSKKMSPNTTIKYELPCRLWAVDSLDRRAHLDQCLLLVCMLFYLDSTLCVQGDRQKNNTQKREIDKLYLGVKKDVFPGLQLNTYKNSTRGVRRLHPPDTNAEQSEQQRTDCHPGITKRPLQHLHVVQRW